MGLVICSMDFAHDRIALTSFFLFLFFVQVPNDYQHQTKTHTLFSTAALVLGKPVCVYPHTLDNICFSMKHDQAGLVSGDVG